MSQSLVTADKPDGPHGRRRPQGARRPPSRPARLPAVRRPGGHRLDRLYGSGQFRHQHPGRRAIRLHPAVGGPARQLIAMLFQALSAKLGIVTGQNLARDVPRHISRRPLVWAMWVISEIAAMATDLAEFLGGAIGLSLLFRMPLLAGMVVTAIVTYAHVDVAALRLPADRAHHRRDGRASLRSATWSRCSSRRSTGGRFAYHTVVPQIAGAESAAARGRHHRRDRDAARDLSAFRPDPGPHARAHDDERRSAACASPTGGRLCASPSPAWSTWRW